MSLGDWQTGLAKLVVARASGRPGAALDGLCLTGPERAWLEWLGGTPGFAMTCQVQRWWRSVRLRWAARLTLGVLGADRAARTIDAYLDAVPAFSLFFVPEAVRFLTFARQATPEVPHLDSVARFERALLTAAQPTPEPAEEVVVFAAPPEELLGAILSGSPLPLTEGAEYPVLVSPALTHRWCALGGM